MALIYTFSSVAVTDLSALNHCNSYMERYVHVIESIRKQIEYSESHDRSNVIEQINTGDGDVWIANC